MTDKQTTTSTITMEIPRVVPSLNQWQRMHWAERRREKKAWVSDVMVHANKYPGHGNQKRYIVITSHRKGRLDHDNLVGGCKPVLDALTKNGIIKDDSPDWVSVEYKQVVSRKKPVRTIVEVM